MTPGRADALVAPVVGGGACRWNDSPVPLFAVPMVRALRLGASATAVTGGAVAMDGMVGAVTMAGSSHRFQSQLFRTQPTKHSVLTT